jgi:hypothetical protein
MQLTAEALANLTSKTCKGWPECHCYEFLGLWGKLLSDPGKRWSRDHLAALEDLIFINLCCVQGRCPDKIVRDYAKGQLSKSYWDNQRKKSIWDH